MSAVPPSPSPSPPSPSPSPPPPSPSPPSPSPSPPPDLNCKRYIAVFPAGPEQQAQDQSDPRRTSTASARSQCSPPNSKLRIRVIPAGSPPQALNQSGASTASSGSECYSPGLAPDQSVPRRTSTASSGSECSPPDLNHKESPKIYQIECQKRMSE